MTQPFLLPAFWRDTFLAQPFYGNPVWNWLLAVVVLLLAFPVRKLTLLLVRRLVAKTPVADKLLLALTGVIRLLVLLLAFLAVTRSGLLVFGPVWQKVLSQVADTMKAVLLCLAVAQIGKGLLDFQIKKARQAGDKEVRTVFNFYRMVVYLAMIVLASFMVLRIWGFDITGLIAGLGIGGLALSLAAQDTFSNLLGGLTIMTDRSFAIGDFISTPDVEGVVEAIHFRSTKVRTLTQFLVTVPNKLLSNNTVTNLSRIEKRRVRFTVYLEHGTRADQVRRLMEALKERLKAREAVIDDTVLVSLQGLTANALEVLVQCYIQLPDFSGALQEQEAILIMVMTTLEEQQLAFAGGQRLSIQQTRDGSSGGLSS